MLPTNAITLLHDLEAAIAERATLHDVSLLYAAYVTTCCAGNTSRAAFALGIHRRTLHRWRASKAVV